MIVPDHAKNIQRIIDKIKHDDSLYDNGDTPGKLRDVFFGDPENNDKQSHPQMPYLYVTTTTQLQTTRRDIGITMPQSANQIVVQYELVIVSRSDSTTINAQKQMYEIIKNLVALTQTDPLFADPITGLDPVFSRSVISEMPYDESTRGKLVNSVSLILLCTVGSTYSIVFPGIGEVPFLSTPSNPDGIIFDENYTQNGTRTITPNGDFGSLYAEYESTVQLDESFRAKYGTEEQITIKKGDHARTVNAVYVEINPTVSYDSIQRSILHLEIVK